MRVPKTLESLAEQGIVQEVLRPLMSGKEAQIYLVVSQDEICAAKVYKEAQNRSFKNRADYMEGRKVRNTRDQRAMKKGSTYGKSKDEESWRTTEVDMIYRLHAAGVRVPTPHLFMDGVLIMELVKDEAGGPAPRLGDLDYTPAEATEIYHHLLREVIRMLCAGVVHGDLSDFNVLLSADGPVVIDFPQSINAADNQNARQLLLRDVANLHRFVKRFAPSTRRQPYGEEIWKLYENNQLTPETQLTGTFRQASAKVDTNAVLDLISDANEEEAQRRQRARGVPNAGRSATTGRAPTANNTGGAPLANNTGGVARPRIIEVTPKRPVLNQGRSSGGSGSGSGERSRGPNTGGRFSPAEPRRNASDPQRSAHDTGTKTSRKPKRGDAAQTSTYVSPAARKDTFSLTPRDAAPKAPGNRADETNKEATPKKRRRRCSRGRSDGAAQAPQSTPAPVGSNTGKSEQRPKAGPRSDTKELGANRNENAQPNKPRLGDAPADPNSPNSGGSEPGQQGARRRRRRRNSAA